MSKWKVRVTYSREAVERILNDMEKRDYEFKSITDGGSPKDGYQYTLVFKRFPRYLVRNVVRPATEANLSVPNVN